MKETFALIFFCLACIFASLTCVICADYLVSLETLPGNGVWVDKLPSPHQADGPFQHHMTWEWLRFAAWAFGLLPIIGFAACCIESDSS